MLWVNCSKHPCRFYLHNTVFHSSAFDIYTGFKYNIKKVLNDILLCYIKTRTKCPKEARLEQLYNLVCNDVLSFSIQSCKVM